MKRLFFISCILLLSGCESTGRHFKFMSECDNEVAGRVPPNYMQQISRYDTTCSKRGSGTIDRTGSISSRGSSECTTVPIYETVDLNYGKRLQLRNECIERKKYNYQSSFQPEVKSFRTNVEQGKKSDAISKECGLLDIQSRKPGLSKYERNQAKKQFDECLLRLEKSRNAGE